MVEGEVGVKIRCLRSDNGGEYTLDEFDQYLHGVGYDVNLHVPTCHNKMV